MTNDWQSTMLLLNPFLRRSSSRSATSGRARTGRRERMTAEALEVRSLLTAVAWPGLSDPQFDNDATGDNDTLDMAQDLGQVHVGRAAEFTGVIGDSAATSTDVDWLSFTLESPGRVRIQTLPNFSGTTTPVVLTLYGEELSEFDPAVPLGHQLLTRQDPGLGDLTSVDANLSAGTYFVAVSGAGNRFFYPFLADSGLPGSSGEFGMSISVVPGVAAGLGTSIQREFGQLGNDTPPTAIDLGEIAGAAHLQVEGTIGDDRFYNLTRTNPFAQNPAADVDLYHIRITGAGHFAFVADAFAGRIGSALDPALTLFRADENGVLQQIAANNNTLNPVESTNQQIPLFADSTLFAGLTAGDYFVAVSSAGNDAESGPDGVFQPNVAHSGLNGGSTGDYVLNVLAYADNEPPTVVGLVFSVPGVGEIPLRDGHIESLPHAPTHVAIQFSEAVNATLLAYLESQEVNDNTSRPVFILGAGGTRYLPRLQAFDTRTNIATFLMLDGLPNGSFELHVSGQQGLADLAGLPIVANDPSGDFVTRFTVNGAPRGSAAGPTVWNNQPANDDLDSAQDLGVVFPRDLQNGVTVIRDAATNAAQSTDNADTFRLELLASRTVSFTLRDVTENGVSLQIFNEHGQPMSLLSINGGTLIIGFLPAGAYFARVSGWNPATSLDVTYRLELRLLGASENPTPLTSGAAPAVAIQLRGTGAPILITPAAPESTVIAQSPTGLLQGLNAPALGGQGVTTPVYSPDTALVRLFGISNRDGLFALIDSSLPRATEPPEVTQAELTDDELRELLNQNGETTGESEASQSTDEATDTSTHEELPTESELLEVGEDSNEQTDPDTRTRAARSRLMETQSTKEQPPSAISAPLAMALATSLASTLRERERRLRSQVVTRPRIV